MTHTLITGGSGRLGKQLVKIFEGSLHPTRQELNVVDRIRVFEYVRQHRPEILIHCAALTGIKQCEENKELAWTTNVEGARNLVDACEAISPDTHFVYVSTACVFRGDRGDYVETDVPYPKNFYSLTKLVGESALINSSLKNWLIVRTNFTSRERWPYPRAFTDRFGTYLFANDVAAAIRDVINAGLTLILHICGDMKLSMYDLAKITTPDVQPMTMADYEGPPLTIDMSLKSVRIPCFRFRG